MMPDPLVWRALVACAEGGNLWRCSILDHIQCGVVVRAPFGGWGYSLGEEGEMQFPDERSSRLAMITCWPEVPFIRARRPV